MNKRDLIRENAILKIRLGTTLERLDASEQLVEEVRRRERITERICSRYMQRVPEVWIQAGQEQAWRAGIGHVVQLEDG